MILVVGAMVEELQTIIEEFKLTPTPNTNFLEFKSPEKKPRLLVGVTGIGTVNASAGLSYFLTKYPKIDYVLVLGTAGSTSEELKQGDLVLIKKATYGQVNVCAFGYQLGQVPKMPANYAADEILTRQILNLLNPKMELKLINGATLDLFVENDAQVKQILDPLPIATQIVDMEMAGFYQTAYLFAIPIVGIKIVSDSIVSQPSSTKEFDEFLPLARVKLKEVLHLLLQKTK